MLCMSTATFRGSDSRWESSQEWRKSCGWLSYSLFGDVRSLGGCPELLRKM